VNVLDDFVRQWRQPGIDRDPFGLPAFAHLIDRWQRFEFRLGSFIGALWSPMRQRWEAPR
jgi:hypothetical protein